MPQGIGLVLYELLSVDEHLRFCQCCNIKQDEAFLEYKHRLLKMAGLEAFTDRLAGEIKRWYDAKALPHLYLTASSKITLTG